MHGEIWAAAICGFCVVLCLLLLFGNLKLYTEIMKEKSQRGRIN